MDRATGDRATGRRRMGVQIESLESRLFLSSAELVRNGGFEGTVSSSDWVRSGLLQADSRFGNYHNSPGYAYLSDLNGNAANSISGSMYQQFAIPATASSVTLNFWTKITTSETTTTLSNDLLTAQVYDSTGTTLLQTASSLSNLNASASYVQRTIGLSRSLIGQTVRLVFSASTDAALATTFRVDDVSVNAVSPATSGRVVAYLPEYRYSSVFSKLDFNLMTHANYFSISAAADGSLSTGGVNAAHLDTAVAALHAAGDTVSITVGPVSFSTLAADATARMAFANNVVNYALAHNLDGIDIDWEPPAGNSVANYALLINDLYTVGHPLHMLITAAVNPWTNEIPVTAVNTKMDWLNVMCYDFAPANHETYSDAISGMVDWTNYGVAKNKIVMGVGFYGRSGTTWSNTVSKGYNTSLSDYYAANGVYPPPDMDTYNGYYFNGVTTIEKKAAYVRDNGYGGMMTWEVGMDHYDASGKYDQYSLLPVMNSMMRPPAWLTPSAGAMYDLVNQQLILGSGTITFNGDASASNPNLVITAPSGTAAVFNADQRLGGLNVSGTGKLDLKSNDLILDYSASSPIGTWDGSSYTGVLGMVKSGRNGGSWNGSGMYSSTTGGSLHTLAVAEASQVKGIAGTQTALFDGKTIDATTVLVKYTYGGDANLDGKINVDDYTRIDFNVALGSAGYFNGDFNYDGKINVDDYTIIDFNVGIQGAPIASGAAMASASSLQSQTYFVQPPTVWPAAKPADDASSSLPDLLV
jgi:hypothetical protein